jgi:hypothetical protein
MERSPPRIISASAEPSDPSRAPVSYGHLTFSNNHRHLPLAPTVLQHLFHPAGIGLHVIIDMLRIRLTGASGIGSALLSVNNCLAHSVPPFV